MLRQFGRFSEAAGLKEVVAASDIFALQMNCPATNWPDGDAFYSRCAIAIDRFVRIVKGGCGVTKIDPPVIALYAINMVNLNGWMRSLHVKKSKTVDRVGSVIQLNLDIPTSAPSKFLSAFSKMRKYPSFGIVMYKFAKTSLRYNRHIHFTTSNSGLIGGGSTNCRTPNYTKTNRKGH